LHNGGCIFPNMNAINEPIEIPVNEAIEILGSQQNLAKACDLSQAAVWKWTRGKGVSAKNAIKVEKATQGRVTRQRLCPDVFGEQEPTSQSSS